MKELLGNSDFLTIHTGLNQDSSNMLGRDEFSKMKKSSYLINTARGVSLMKMIGRGPTEKVDSGGEILIATNLLLKVIKPVALIELNRVTTYW